MVKLSASDAKAPTKDDSGLITEIDHPRSNAGISVSSIIVVGLFTILSLARGHVLDDDRKAKVNAQPSWTHHYGGST